MLKVVYFLAVKARFQIQHQQQHTLLTLKVEVLCHQDKVHTQKVGSQPQVAEALMPKVIMVLRLVKALMLKVDLLLLLGLILMLKVIARLQ